MQVAFEVDDRTANGTGSFLLHLHRFAFDDVFEAYFTLDLRENRSSKRVPATKHALGFDLATFGDRQRRTSRNLVRFQFAATLVANRDFCVSVQDNCVAIAVNNRSHADQFCKTALITTLFVFLGGCIGNTTNMEGTHRQLSTRFTDRLSRNDTDGHALFDHIAGRHVHAVTLATNTQRSVTSHRAANLNLLKSHVFDLLSDLRCDHLRFGNDHFIGNRVNNVLTRDATVDRCRQSNFNLFTSENNSFGNTLSRPTIFHRDNHVLRDVSQLTS